MGKGLNRLYARQVATLTRRGYYADGGGLYLQISKAGTKNWIFRYTSAGRTRDMGLGALADVTLPEAREKAAGYRKLRIDGKDPLASRQEQRAAAGAVPTFAAASTSYIEGHKAAWTNPKHAKQWQASLETYAFPVIGKKGVDVVDTQDMLTMLKPIWLSKTETASRLRQRVEKILDAETSSGHRKGENPARWRGHLANLLPKPGSVKKGRHFPAVPYQDLPAFMIELRARKERSARALEFTIVTVARTSMTVKAKWSEIDGELWKLSKERMKAKRPHTVPLSGYALRILTRLERGREGDWIFPGELKPYMSTAAMDTLLERMGYGHFTVHGFRSTFKDWAAEQTHTPNEVSEAALAHTIKDKAEAAYRRGEMLEKRKVLMEAWGTYCL